MFVCLSRRSKELVLFLRFSCFGFVSVDFNIPISSSHRAAGICATPATWVTTTLQSRYSTCDIVTLLLPFSNTQTSYYICSVCIWLPLDKSWFCNIFLLSNIMLPVLPLHYLRHILLRIWTSVCWMLLILLSFCYDFLLSYV